ncbi:MAG: AMP-binding protein [Pseudomonadota bacterium]
MGDFDSHFDGETLFDALSAAARKYDDGKPVVEDAVGGSITYKRLMTGARILGTKLSKFTEKGEIVAVLLPNANAVAATFIGLQSAGRIPAMLNYSAGPSVVVSACKTVQARSVIASRKFVEKAELEKTVEALEAAGLQMIWLEDVATKINSLDKVVGLLLRNQSLTRGDPEGRALILFTSGSEGLPKAVVLSHRNILSNCSQIENRIDFTPKDKLFNVLPVFHSFGMTGGLILPLLFGVRLYLYPSPLHYKQIPQAIAKSKPTILFGTDTFLTGYARTAKNSDFDTLRLVVAGAEAVRDETRKNWRDRFNTQVLEGFGMTEAAPVVAVNTPEENRPGTVGKLLPGLEARLDPVDGIAEGGRLHVRGPNVMMGYIRAEKPGVLEPVPEGWHDSGDIVTIDDDGFVKIRGRVKRFAKIAGEMVSLGAVENLASDLWPDSDHAVVSIPDKRKGERIVLVTTEKDAKRDDILAASRKNGLSDLMVPANIVYTEAVPVLGTGKIDYHKAREYALDKLASNTSA